MLTAPDTQVVLVPPAVAKLFELFCGCGTPELAWQAVRDYLSNKLRPQTGSDYFLAYVLNDLEFAEHSISVNYCWPTDAGKIVLEFLDQWGFGWSDRPDVEFILPNGGLANVPQ